LLILGGDSESQRINGYTSSAATSVAPSDEETSKYFINLLN
jgi:hypothetical protein